MKCCKQAHQNIPKRMNCNTWELILRYPLGSIGYLLHYHRLGYADCPLGTRDCDFPEKQGRRKNVKTLDEEED